MSNKYTEQDVVDRVYAEIAAGKKIRAKTILTLCTNLGTNDRKAVINGDLELTADQITNTDLDNMNKAGCTVGSASLLLICFLLLSVIFKAVN